MNDLISVIVPIYNVSPYLSKCLNSIINQTYTNLDIILVNDGSTDSSLDICYKYKKKDKRIRIINKKNGGLSDARNAGIEIMKGKYVAFIDSDDYVSYNYIFELYNSILKNNSEVAICSFTLVDAFDNVIKKEIVDYKKEEIKGKDILSEALTNYGYKYIVAWNKLYSSYLFENLRFDYGKIYEDEYIHFKLFYNVNKVSLVEEPLYFYVQRNGSIVLSNMDLKKIQMKNEMHYLRLKFYENHNEELLYIKARQMYCNWIIDTFMKYKNILDTSYKKKLKNDMKTYGLSAYKSHYYGIEIRLQDYLGAINISLAATLKRVYLIIKY